MEPIQTRLESVLNHEIEKNHKTIQISGTSSPVALALFFSQSQSKTINLLPHLVILHEEAVALRLLESIHFFDPQRRVFFLPEHESSPYSELFSSPKIIHDRLRFLYGAAHSLPGDIFITTATSLGQLVLPFSEFVKHSKLIRRGDDLPSHPAQLFNFLGYETSPVVEDKGHYAIRGGIVDIFSPVDDNPVRIELFGNQVESIRYFDRHTQRNLEETSSLNLIPAHECLYDSENLEKVISSFKASSESRHVQPKEVSEILRSLALQQNFPEIEFLGPYFYGQLDSPLNYFSSELNVWHFEPTELAKSSDTLSNDLSESRTASLSKAICPSVESIYTSYEKLNFPDSSRHFYITNLAALGDINYHISLDYKTFSVSELTQIGSSFSFNSPEWKIGVQTKLNKWKGNGYTIFISVKNQTILEKLFLSLSDLNFKPAKCLTDDYSWGSWIYEQQKDSRILHLISRPVPESVRLEDEKIIFLRDYDFFGKNSRTPTSAKQDFNKAAKRLSFGDLKPGDLVVHVKHGIGRYEGLKVMEINGAPSEFIQVAYKDTDKLYLPVYRVASLQKYSGVAPTTVLDRLGGLAWEKTKTKVRSRLRDVASDLLALYAKRAEVHRPPFILNENDIDIFNKAFPYEETDDQLKAINDIKSDFLSSRPMDRLICGDVGFGKTEVAMRAAFFAVLNKKQVAVLAPTTVLTFQHFETFKKRFQNWPVEIQCLNRFVKTTDQKKILTGAKEGRVDILIGTHRLLSKDVQFKDLGLLIIDEEQKFGVLHKERIKKLKINVDTIAMSATPIPRTLNLSLVGIRDISLINTAPVDRLPTRTFVCKFNDDTIKKAIDSEIKRGGQIYFIHNRIQSIYGLADELRRIVPQARLKIAHGQMKEEDLEKTMLDFFHHEIDILVCTAIVESGMDVPRANTIFIDSAHMFGLSQLYQLRGRVGRSKSRAYCYLVLPAHKKIENEAQERLKIIQENSSLGSGIKIAQYDLELRGSGSILGDVQSGQVDSVGYELYLDLLNEALAKARGETIDDIELDPEINLRLAALIPDNYISDVRLRLGYYKALSDIKSPDELNQIEDEMTEQFGKIPNETLNLMGLMLIRLHCKQLGVKDVTAGLKTITLVFSEKTHIKPETVIQLAMRENKKYSLGPDNKLIVRMNSITWANVLSELEYLLKL